MVLDNFFNREKLAGFNFRLLIFLDIIIKIRLSTAESTRSKPFKVAEIST